MRVQIPSTSPDLSFLVFLFIVMKTSIFYSLTVIVLMLTFLGVRGCSAGDVYQTISDSSVTVESAFTSASGVVFTRKDSTCTQDISFVWTAGHFVDATKKVALQLFSFENITNRVPGLLNVVTVTHYEFKDGVICKTNTSAGTVIKSSIESSNGIDIALIRLHTNFPHAKSVTFNLKKENPKIGSRVHTVSSPYSLYGTASEGIYSFIGRKTDNGEYDQTTMPVFPGSSGAGVFTSDGQCVGFVVALKSPSLNFIVPMRKVKEWAVREKVEWALDPEYPMVSDIELMLLPPWDVPFFDFFQIKTNAVSP